VKKREQVGEVLRELDVFFRAGMGMMEEKTKITTTTTVF